MAKVYGFDEAGFRRVVAATQQVLRTPTKGSQRTARQPVLSGGGGGAQIIRFTVTSVSCPGVAAVGTVTAVMCSGSEASVGDSVDLTDPLGYLVGPTALLIGHTGFAVSMHEPDPYSGADCVYEIMSMDDLGYNC